MKDVRAVIFDLDGTLFDLTPLVLAARRRVAGLLHEGGLFATASYALKRINDLERRHGPYYSSSPYYFAFYDLAKAACRDRPEAVADLVRRHDRPDPDTDPVERVVRVLEQVYNADDVESIRPYPDVPQALCELREAGCLLFLVTFGRAARQRNKIQRLGIEGRFDRIVNEGPPSHAYWFEELQKEHGLLPHQVAVVGDRARDEVRAGNRLGMHTIWLRRGRYSDDEPLEGDRPHHTVRFVAQVPTLLHLARRGKDPDHLRTVVIGGGTGLPTVLRGVKTYAKRPTAIVAVTDTGASSGRIRWNLGVQPPGDIRNALTALADPERVSPGLFRVFHHRFPSDEKQAGIFKNDHIGNFLVAALTQQTGDFQKAIDIASEMLHVQGLILPASVDNVDICAELSTGEHRYTEWMVRKPGKPPLKRAYLVHNRTILEEVARKGGVLRRVEDPVSGQVEIHARSGKALRAASNGVRASPGAVDAIAEADIVVIGPGSLFTSVITNLLVPDIRRALVARDRGKTFYVCNITTQPGQSDGFRASDHVKAIQDHLSGEGAKALYAIDRVLVQDTTVFRTPKGRAWGPLVRRFLGDGKALVEADEAALDAMVPWTKADLVEEYSPEVLTRGAGDFISHDSHKVADALCRLYCGLPIPDYWGLGGG
jgi:2-phospho-L-lactate transferase/gluconeogenesis factor (CofD/UPF0052 family)/FMN phosphatase YigB (HAD superfamily)